KLVKRRVERRRDPPEQGAQDGLILEGAVEAEAENGAGGEDDGVADVAVPDLVTADAHAFERRPGVWQGSKLDVDLPRELHRAERRRDIEQPDPHAVVVDPRVADEGAS